MSTFLMNTAVMRDMDKLLIALGILSGVLMLWTAQSNSRGLPRREILDGFEGGTVRGNAEINGATYNVTFIIGERQLGLMSKFPDIGIILNYDDLHISISKEFIGSRVKITSSDFYLEHFLKEIVISHRLARKIERLSSGKFLYGSA